MLLSVGVSSELLDGDKGCQPCPRFWVRGKNPVFNFRIGRAGERAFSHGLRHCRQRTPQGSISVDRYGSIQKCNMEPVVDRSARPKGTLSASGRKADGFLSCLTCRCYRGWPI